MRPLVGQQCREYGGRLWLRLVSVAGGVGKVRRADGSGELWEVSMARLSTAPCSATPRKTGEQP